MAEISVRVQPRSSQNKIVVVDGVVKVWVTASPTDGQANAAVCELISDKLDVAKSRVSVSKGHASRSKLISVSELSTDEVLQMLSS